MFMIHVTFGEETSLKGLKNPVHPSYNGFYVNLWFALHGTYVLSTQAGTYERKKKNHKV